MLHVTLRELLTTRGPGVLRDAEEFRGALDDFLAEDEATTGEVNVLVDAVRLGALPRLLTLLAGGAAPDAAISEVGDGLARDRGADDVRRPRWALAVLAYALGRIESSAYLVAAPPGTVDIHRATQPLPDEEPGVPAPVVSPTPTPPPPPPPPPPVLEPTPEPAPPRVSPVVPDERKSGGARSALAVVLVVLLVAGVGAVAAWWWLSRGDDDTSADDESSETAEPSDKQTKKDEPKPLTGKLPDNELVTSILDESTGEERLYRVDTETGKAKAISDSPATLPTITPDRRYVIYLVPTDAGGRELRILDLVEGTDESLFPAGSPCQYGNRPAFSPEGDRIVLTCASSSGAGQGLYVASVDGGEPEQISTLSGGAPTWAPDGIYFFLGKEFDDSAIYRLPEEGGEEPEQVSPDDGFTYADPDWSEESGLLVLRLGDRVEAGTPEGDLVYVDRNGDEQTIDVGVTVGHPAWSADGRSVVFLAENSAEVERVAIASLDAPQEWRPLEIKVKGETIDGNPTAPAWGTR